MSRQQETKKPGKGQRRSYPPPSADDPPLLRVLIAEAMRRGDTLAAMAKCLGVSYRRVAQWRRREADVANASRVVVEAAAAYLGIPTVYVLCMCGVIGLRDFVPPGDITRRERMQQELEPLRQDGRFAGLIPDALIRADLAVQRLVLLLYRELCADESQSGRAFEWVRAIHLAALGNAQAERELALLRRRNDPK